MKRVGLLTSQDPFDANSFSGTLFYLREGLEKRGDLNVESISHDRFPRNSVSLFINKVTKKIFNFNIFERKINSIQKKISSSNYDLVIAVVCSNLVTKINIPENSKLLFVTDATPKFLKDFYNWDIPESALDDEIEVIKKSFAIIYSSSYISDLAKKEFGKLGCNDKMHAVPFGLNFSDCSTEFSLLNLDEKINLLFIGKDWERKGGKKCLEIFQLLRSRGYNANLTIIGCNPVVNDPHITLFPYLDKNTKKDLVTYEEVLKNTHFLILPTLADCTPMVIAEANSFSVPVLSSSVGGIPFIVDDTVNGHLFDITDSAMSYVNVIEKYFGDDSYLSLRESSFEVFRTKLNWNSWVSKTISISEH
ncbi:glycosyltransferase family 4 protein [Alteromonas stellipolaris]|uniref:glycosyltransferase family 4 protein n=1 Tax=Alteromonas stellipolaris TaxID=233316 RepID=UPI002118D129|nr:glycosyltransferase family 4 protein [Alteromonas stellipolaris]MCQ8847325.1 glycosyltransferase family 4 protein [Alteromonas stellipolaris]